MEKIKSITIKYNGNEVFIPIIVDDIHGSINDPIIKFSFANECEYTIALPTETLSSRMRNEFISEKKEERISQWSAKSRTYANNI